MSFQKLLIDARARLQLSEHVVGDGPALWDTGCQIGLEGLVSKREDSPYRSGRSELWLKATCRKRETFTVVGYAMKGNKFDGIYLARPAHGLGGTPEK